MGGGVIFISISHGGGGDIFFDIDRLSYKRNNTVILSIPVFIWTKLVIIRDQGNINIHIDWLSIRDQGNINIHIDWLSIRGQGNINIHIDWLSIRESTYLL